MSEVKPGVYEGMSEADYEAIPALRWSRLKEYLRSPAHGRAAEGRVRESADLDLGKAIHTAILEPDQFDTRFGMIPEDAPAKRSNADKAWWAEFWKNNAGRIMLEPDDLKLVREARDAAYSHPRAKLWLTSPKSKREVVIVWLDQIGRLCKARLDLVSNVEGVTRVIDVKSTRNASLWGFSKEISDHRYHGQVAFYLRGLDAIAPGFDRSAAFIAIEKTDPPVLACYDLGPASLEVGQDEVNRALATFVQCEAEGKWPGYPDAVIDLPAYKLKGVEQ